jgi:glycosyltransferase involved in cell wall biosynthesis
MQIYLRRRVAAYKRKKYAHIWPINSQAAAPPEGWKGWPDGKDFALVLSHDVDTRKGYENCLKLADLEESMGFRSSFNFVPELYGRVSLSLLDELRDRGFEVAVHGLKHDGKLFQSRRIFNRRADRINGYLKEWRTRGFTSPSMHHNLSWLTGLDIDYAISTFDTDPFEPQPDAVETIFPFLIYRNSSDSTTSQSPGFQVFQPQNFFVELEEKTIEIWKQKLNWIAEKGGMVLINTHPDYMNFSYEVIGNLEYPVRYYVDFLEYVKNSYKGRYYHTKPSQIAAFYKQQYLSTNQPNQLKQTIRPNKLGKPNQLNNPSQPNHILFIVENNTVPPDIRVWREAKTAKQAGCKVSVIAPVNKKFSKRYEIVDGIEIYRHLHFERHGSRYHQVIEYLNAFLWETYLSIKIFIKKPFKIIHAANPPDNIFLIALLFRIFGVKFVFDHHDLSPELYVCKFNGSKIVIFKLLRLLEKLSCKTADAIISTNNSFKNHVVKIHKAKPEKVYIVRNDPAVSRFPEPKNEKGKKNGQPINLLYVGEISIQDGVDLLIKTIKILVSQLGYEEIKCTIIGDGDALQGARQLSTQIGVKTYIDFTGYIYDRQLIRQYINEADICVEPAPYNEANKRSTFIKIMEYMACGKPIVAFDLGETRASVGNAAILVEPGNLIEFAHALLNLIENPQKRFSLGSMARDRIVRRLNWENASSMLTMAYDNLLWRN